MSIYLTTSVSHGAPITGSAAHKLLYKAKDIKTINCKDIIQLYKMVIQMGGMPLVAEMNDEDGRTFKTKAQQISLINESCGVLRYDLWNLLCLAQYLDPDRTEVNEANKMLEMELTQITKRFHAKEKSDVSLGNSIVTLFNAGGTPVAALGCCVDEIQEEKAFIRFLS